MPSCEGDYLIRGLLLVNACFALFLARSSHTGCFTKFFAFPLLFSCIIQLLDVRGWGLGFGRVFVSLSFTACLYKSSPFLVDLLWNDMSSLEGKFPDKFRPRFYPSSATHSRFTPIKHKFRYPILYVGIPINFKGSVGGVFSVAKSTSEKEEDLKLHRQPSESPFTLFSLDPSKYFNPTLPFEKKLDSVLLQYGYKPSAYPFAYLVTTPRFLGYSFNPVSYYYLYSADQKLRLVVLEVNNTFGESQLYILNADNPTNPRPRAGYDFAGEMEKVFHISPFNHRSGSYCIQIRDPLGPGSSKHAELDVHMVVMAGDGQKTMVARAFSTGPSVDVLAGSVWQGLWIALSWGFNTFLAVPATMFEAWKIYKKKTPVYTRPEPLVGSGQRDATKAELQMQKLWLNFFQQRIKNYRLPISVLLSLPQSNATKEAKTVVFHSGSTKPVPIETPAALTIRVKNPRFFARFFGHQDPHQTVYLDISSQPAERRIAEINDLQLFLDILSPSAADCHTVPKFHWRGLKWGITTWLRRWKTASDFAALPLLILPEDGLVAPPAILPVGTLSALDQHYLCGQQSSEDQQSEKHYRQKTIQSVLVDLVAFGEGESLELYEKIFNFILFTLLIGMSISLAANFSASDALGRLLCDPSTILQSESMNLAIKLAAINGLWVWKAAKTNF